MCDNLPSIQKFHDNGKSKLRALEKFGYKLSSAITHFKDSLKECTEELY
jgi:hypothetical protein